MKRDSEALHSLSLSILNSIFSDIVKRAYVHTYVHRHKYLKRYCKYITVEMKYSCLV